MSNSLLIAYHLICINRVLILIYAKISKNHSNAPPLLRRPQPLQLSYQVVSIVGYLLNYLKTNNYPPFDPSDLREY